VSACKKCGVEAGPSVKLCGRCEPKRCNVDAGGCGRSEQEGAVLRDGSALCEACQESIAEAKADEDQKLADARAIRRSRASRKAPAEPLAILRARKLADAFHAVGKVNHYMVGVTFNFTPDDLDAAEQLLIDRQNAGPQKGAAFQALERALDEIENERLKKFVQVEQKKGGAK
jgi:hypothetical protein